MGVKGNMTPININNLNDKPDSPSGVMVSVSYPTVKPAQGNDGKAVMYQGLFGGKNPVSGK